MYLENFTEEKKIAWNEANQNFSHHFASKKF